MKSVFKNYPKLQEKLLLEMYDVYMNEGRDYNTDLIIMEDGSIKRHNYFGNITYMSPGIEAVMTIKACDKQAWDEMNKDGLTPEQLEYCEKRGWYSIYQADSDNPSDWVEFVPDTSDLVDLLFDFINEYEYEKDLIN